MHESNPNQEFVGELLTRLGLQPGDANKAYGEIQGNPATLTILCDDPLALLVAFKIPTPHPTEITLPESLEALREDGRVEVELEDGMAWLTLKDQSNESAAATQELIESFGAALVLAEVAYPPGCNLCRGLDGDQLVFAEGRCCRLCDNCAEQLARKRNAAEHALNKPTTFHALGLLPAFVGVALGWVVFWLSIDLLLEWWNPGQIETADLMLGFLMITLGGVGCCLGFPLGVFLRKSGVASRFPVAVTLLTVLPAGLLGEFLYITVCGFRQAGIFDFVLAAQWFVPFVKSYPVSWLVGKILVLGGIALGCHLGVKAQKKVALRL